MQDRNLFHKFIEEMNDILRKNESGDERDQKNLLNDLFKLENDFKKVLLSNKAGKEVYVKFMDFIVNDKGNILTTRVYFRERQSTFSKKIAIAFHRRKPDMLHKFRINYLFASWALNKYKGNKKRKLRALLNKIEGVRTLLLENNLPLAINRARIFWSKVPESHLQYMDLIQNSSEGLMNAIDKFVPPYKKVFRSVAIGRMTLNMITDQNATMVKLSPKERRILYRANNAKNKAKLSDDKEVVDYVNESFGGVTSEELAEIVSAASSVTDIYHKDENRLSVADKVSNGDEVEEDIVNNDLKDKLKQALHRLTIIERKVVKLKNGV